MKKYVTLLLFVVLMGSLCGCGKDKITSTSCTLSQSGMEMAYTLTATNDKIDKISLTITPDNTLFGVDSLSTLTDEQKEQVKTGMLTNLGLEKDNYEGLKIDIKIEDKMDIKVDADLKKADKEILKKIGMDFSKTNMSLKDAKEEMAETGATCK